MTYAYTPGMISVIVPFLDEERFLNEAIASVVDQHYRPVELILVDDGSTDSSFEIAENTPCGDLNVKLLRHDENRGLAAARNTGICAATGEYFTYLDADDIMTPNRLVEMLPTLQSSPEVDILIGRDELLLEPGVIPAPAMMGGRVDGQLYYPLSMIYGRDVHDAVGGFDVRFELCEDLDWMQRAEALGLRWKKTDCVALKRRAHDSNLSHDWDRINLFRVRAARELILRNRTGASHYVDPTKGIPSG